MRPQAYRNILVFIVGAVVAYFVFDSLSHYLEDIKILPVPLIAVVPFVLLLASIAIVPFINRHWWEKRYPLVSLTLGAVIVAYYVIAVHNTPRLFLTLYEFTSFISLIGSLFVVSGGVHLRIRGKAAPHENVILLAIGAVISNILGTTGASMLLIRPYLRVNKFRIKGYHVVFFIFVVSNIGGALTPIGDPPLFLGYLKGVPFFWLISRVWYIWALTVGLVLLVFYIIDSYSLRKATRRVHELAAQHEEPEVTGLHNIAFLAVILGAVFVEKPIMLREILMWSAAIASYYTTKQEIHKKNDFNFIPIKEVAILFAGIFATMIPALDWLELNSQSLGIVVPGQYFWGTGVLSSFLDNAPTYLNFLSAAFGLHGANVDNMEHMRVMVDLATPASLGLPNPLRPGAVMINADTWRYVQAISMGAVFFGANTYIGNGPNFMVKSISEQAGVECPSFFGYMVKYSIPILIPIFVIVWLLFFL
jgi:Na+/H+ antiporter NhaD/arsenite permease-like protein